MQDWRLRLKPTGWLGLFVAAVGTIVIEVAARRGDWALLAAGAVVLIVGATTMLRGFRNL